MTVWVWVSERTGGFFRGRFMQQHKFTSLENSLNKSCCLWVTRPTAAKEWSVVWESLEDKTMEDLFWQSKQAEKIGNLASWLILNLFREQHMPTNTAQFVLSVCTFADDTITYITQLLKVMQKQKKWISWMHINHFLIDSKLICPYTCDLFVKFNIFGL